MAEVARLAEAPRVREKTSSEAIGDQAIALLERANAHICESFDALQAKLDELRNVQLSKMDAARNCIRASMEWGDYMLDSMGQLTDGIEQARGDMSRLR